jgi:hypothetical protein
MVVEILNKINQDMTDRKSAGEVAAKGRRIDRPRREGKIDEEDKEAARALRGVKGKKKAKKKTAPPFYTRVWFTIPAVLLIVAGLAAAIYFVTRPPSLESLLAEATPLMNSPDVEKWDRAIATDGPLDKFQRYHALAPGDAAKALREMVDKANVSYCNRLLGRLLDAARADKPVPKPDGELQTLALKAAEAEDKGDLDSAAKTWKELQTTAKAEGSERPWHLIADQHAKDLARVAAEEARIKDKIAKDYPVFSGYVSPNELEKQVAEALKLEMDGKPQDARAAWDKLKDKLEADPAAHVWLLLALKKHRDLPRDKN